MINIGEATKRFNCPSRCVDDQQVFFCFLFTNEQNAWIIDNVAKLSEYIEMMCDTK